MHKLVFLATAIIMTNLLNASPEIIHISWGKIQVKHDDGSIKNYKDCKVFPSDSKKWNWKETKTEHVPGIQIADLAEFIDSVDIVILSRGMDLVLQTKPETIDYLKKIGKEFYVEQTEKAVALYNKLAKEGKKVGGLFHSTC